MHTKTLRNAWLAGIAGAAALSAQPAAAVQAVWDINLSPANGFGGLTPVWSVADPDSATAEWNVFNSYPLDTSPEVVAFGPGTQSVRELTGGAFLTSGGNIYSFAVATDFVASLGGYSADPLKSRDVALRIATVGTGVDATSVRLGGVAPTVSNLVFDQPFTGSFGGNEQEWLFLWTGVGDSTAYSFDFGALASSMSLDQVALYSSPATVVPLPAAGWLLASALGGLSAWRRRFGGSPARVTAAG
jgi:hypothetical protein